MSACPAPSPFGGVATGAPQHSYEIEMDGSCRARLTSNDVEFVDTCFRIDMDAPLLSEVSTRYAI